MSITGLVKGACIALCVFLSQHVAAQQAMASADTLRLDIKQTEKLFLEKNLQLLAMHYNVQADSALVEQARLWPNPELNTDQNVHSGGKWFAHTTDANGNINGQYYIQLQQLIQTAGKRGKQIQLAATNAGITRWQLNDLLRNLKLQLRSDFYSVLLYQHITGLYLSEKDELDKLLDGMEAQYKAGNVARKDLLRVQALEITLQQDALENQKKLNDAQAELKTLLQVTGNTYLKPVADESMQVKLPGISIADITEQARQNNAAYKLQKLAVQYQQQNLALQKAMAVPDVTVAPNYDQNSNYTPHYFGLGISLPIPVFNRNQGNIKAAKYQVKQEETNMQFTDQQLQNDVLNAYQKLQFTLNLQNEREARFYKDYSELYDKIIESYQKRQISLIEFVDYFDAYKDARQKQLQQELNIQLAKEELNYQAGTDIVP